MFGYIVVFFIILFKNWKGPGAKPPTFLLTFWFERERERETNFYTNKQHLGSKYMGSDNPQMDIWELTIVGPAL